MTELADIIAAFPNPPADLDLQALDPARVPTHIAVIMDGNGRWAKRRGLSRSQGHEAGVEGVRELIEACDDLGVRYLTIYAFSTENWSRPRIEVNKLMSLFADTLTKELKKLEDHHIRLKVLGDIEALPARTRRVFENGVADSADEPGMTLAFAVNYGSRAEIVQSVRSIAERVAAGEIAPDDIDGDLIAAGLYTADMPDPDLLVRTSGERRISNFLLWQIAYSELYVTDVLWPDFDRYELLRAVLDYQGRERRFGGV